MKIVFAAHTPLGDRFVVGSHHLARALAVAGHEVIHLAPPNSPLEYGMAGDFRWRAHWQAARRASVEIDRRLYQLQGVSLLSIKSSLLTLSCNPVLKLTVPSMRRNAISLGFGSVDLLFIDHPCWSGIWHWLHAHKTIYRPTDLYDQCPLGYRFPQMGLGGRVRALESRILVRCAGAVCTSEPVADHVRNLADPDLTVNVLENGVDYPHFSRRQPLPEEYRKISGPRAVYVGALDARFDMPAVTAAADALPDVHFVLIGPIGGERQKLPTNLHLLGARDFKAVPGYLQHADVGLLPLRQSTANSGRSPMKYYEYMAAGLPIVSSATPELTRRENPFVWFYDEAPQMSVSIRQALGRAPNRDAISEMARPYSWPARAQMLLDLVADRQIAVSQEPRRVSAQG